MSLYSNPVQYTNSKCGIGYGNLNCLICLLFVTYSSTNLKIYDKICGAHIFDHILNRCGRFCVGFVIHTKGFLSAVYVVILVFVVPCTFVPVPLQYSFGLRFIGSKLISNRDQRITRVSANFWKSQMSLNIFWQYPSKKKPWYIFLLNCSIGSTKNSEPWYYPDKIWQNLALSVRT
jgi:hypothetical protein